jgi:hypothetical protein
MRLNSFRILVFIILAWILFREKYTLVLYWFVLVGSVEILNRQAKFQKITSVLNIIFFSLLLYSVVLRTFKLHFKPEIHLITNGLEHLLFATIISFKIYLYLATSFPKIKVTLLILISSIIFNAVGLINEVYQNLVGNRKLYAFISDSQTDLFVNIVGSVLFVFIMFRLFAKSQKFKFLQFS